MAATTSISTHQTCRQDPEKLNLLEWLEQHGQVVLSFDLTLTFEGINLEGRPDSFKLPITQLRHLTRLSLNGAPLPSLSAQPDTQQQGAGNSSSSGSGSSDGKVAALLPQLG